MECLPEDEISMQVYKALYLLYNCTIVSIEIT